MLEGNKGDDKLKFRKKPVEIEAEQYKPGMEDGFEERYIDHNYPEQTFGIQAIEEDTPIQVPYIETLEGKHLITKGDWIIIGLKGERYPCKPDIFDMTYEAVEGKYIGCADPRNTQDDDDCYCNECSMGENPDECESFRLENKLTLIYE